MLGARTCAHRVLLWFQEEVVTIIAAEGSDPQSTAASIALTSLHLAEAEGAQLSSEGEAEGAQGFSDGQPSLPTQGPDAGILSRAAPNICHPVAFSGFHLMS